MSKPNFPRLVSTDTFSFSAENSNIGEDKKFTVNKTKGDYVGDPGEALKSQSVYRRYGESADVNANEVYVEMNASDKDYMNAKLEATQERVNARLAIIEARIESGLAKVGADIATLGGDLRIILNMSSMLREDSKNIFETLRSTQAEIQSVRDQRLGFIIWIIGTAIALFLACLAIATFGKDMFDWGQSIK